MTMRPRGVPEDARVPIDVALLVYLDSREEPVNVNVTYEIPLAAISQEDPVHDVMQVCLQNVLSVIDVVREHRLILSDSQQNKFLFLTDHVEAISLMAPSEETITKALEQL